MRPDAWLSAMLMPILWLVGMLVPFVLYLIPAAVVDGLILRCRLHLPRWIVYLVPFVAWNVSWILRGVWGEGTGMGNYLYEPPALSLAPIAVIVLSAPVRRVVRRDPREAEVALLTAVAFAVVTSGLMMPALGDWP